MERTVNRPEGAPAPGPFSRTGLLLGAGGMERLGRARVSVFGVGGVGGYVVEALARRGVGALDLIDSDRVSLTNLNRQILATRSTVGQYKVEAARRRILDINPEARVETFPVFYTPRTADAFDFTRYDYIVDAIDTVTGKLELIERARRAGTPIISCMGAGNKLDPAAFEVADIYETSVCPLARIMRKELRKRGIDRLKVVYSREPPLTPLSDSAELFENSCEGLPEPVRRRQVPGSVAFVPGAAGLVLAGAVIRDLAGVG